MAIFTSDLQSNFLIDFLSIPLCGKGLTIDVGGPTDDVEKDWLLILGEWIILWGRSFGLTIDNVGLKDDWCGEWLTNWQLSKGWLRGSKRTILWNTKILQKFPILKTKIAWCRGSDRWCGEGLTIDVGKDWPLMWGTEKWFGKGLTIVWGTDQWCGGTNRWCEEGLTFHVGKDWMIMSQNSLEKIMIKCYQNKAELF